MRPNLPKEIQEEQDRILKIIMNSDEEMDIDEWFAKYASEEYKDYMAREEKRKAEFLKQGIIVN